MASTVDTVPGALREIPRTRGLETLRNLFAGLTDRVDMLSRLQTLLATHGPVVMHEAGIFRAVNLFGPDANRTVLLDRDRIFSAQRPWDLIMGRVFPNGLLLKDGDDHKHHRKLMHEAFTRPALRKYAEHMNPAIAEKLGAWREVPDFRAFPAFKELTLDLAVSIFLGVDLSGGSRRMNLAFEDMVAASMSRVRLRVPGLEFYRGLKGREFMLEFLRERIDSRREGDGLDMFSRLCVAETEEGERLADQEILDHLIFLMMAAHDTTTSTLCSLTYELARHPEWQERVREESRALGKSDLAFDELDRLPALSRVTKETLRLYPPLPVIPRIATQPFEFGGYEIPANSMVVVSPIVTHHMPEWWNAPTRFDPERFSPERAEDQRHTHAWIPFGGGPHMCLGQRFAEIQIKAVVHQLVQRYRWSTPPGYRMPVQQAPISRPMDGLPLSLDRLD